MKGATNKPVGVATKQGSRSMERSRAASLTSSGTKSSKYSSSLSAHSQLTKAKSKSSDDLSSKAGGSSTANSSRLKKTVTMGTIAELTESKAKSAPGPVSSARHSGIPTPRESATLPKDKVPRERSRTLTSKKPMPVPVSCDIPPPMKQVRPVPKTRAEGEGSDRARLEVQVKELLAEAKAKEFEISKLRCELNRYQDRWTLSSDCTQAALEKNVPEELSESPGDVQSQLKKLQERNLTFQQELGQLRAENQALREQLVALEQLGERAGPGAGGDSTSLEVSLNSEPSSSLHTPSSQDSAGNQTGEAFDRLTVNGGLSHNSVSNMGDVTQGTPSPDSLGCDGVFNPPSASSDSFRTATSSSGTSSDGSLRNASLVSVASLAEKIHQMEENQHCTAEELQATLQELSDQQQVVQELTAENERLTEDKGVLESSFHQQRERLQHLVKENAQLVSLLQDSSKGDPKVSRGLGPEPERGPGESAHSDQEKLLNTQQPVSNRHNLETEHPGAEVLVKSLREEAGNLQKLLEAEQERNAWVAETLANCQASAEELRTQNSQLRRQLELEKPKLSEMPLVQSATGPSVFPELLQVALSEKERECTVLRERSLQATSEVTRLQSLLVKMEREQALSQGKNEGQEQERSFTVQTLQDEMRDKESEIKDMKENIFELQDQVEQHQAVKLHNNRTIVDLENKMLTLEQQKLELEKQLKVLHKKMKEEAEEWSDFQADLQTAVVVANDIKCEAQQEVRVLKRKLQEEEGRNVRLQKELEALQGQRAVMDLILEPLGDDTETPWQRRSISRIPPEPSPKVKTLIKSFDSSLPGGSGFPPQIPAARAPPAAAVSPMQRTPHSGPSSIVKPTIKGPETRKILSKLPLSGVYQRRADGFKSDRYRTPSPSQESVSLLTSLGFSSKIPGTTSSRLSVERKDPLAALAREYGGSKRNALLKWCQRKTEGYPNIDITNFSSSWSDGLAFCALLHTYLPAHFPYQQLCSQDRKRNLTLAFQAAESVGIKPTLDLNEMMGTDRPDWQSVMQYVAQIYRYFES